MLSIPHKSSGGPPEDINVIIDDLIERAESQRFTVQDLLNNAELSREEIKLLNSINKSLGVILDVLMLDTADISHEIITEFTGHLDNFSPIIEYIDTDPETVDVATQDFMNSICRSQDIGEVVHLMRIWRWKGMLETRIKSMNELIEDQTDIVPALRNAVGIRGKICVLLMGALSKLGHKVISVDDVGVVQVGLKKLLRNIDLNLQSSCLRIQRSPYPSFAKRPQSPWSNHEE